ncbi:heparinase II/III family protein [Flavobacteriaceae bacterium F08102]|nr:heparinase II/III family protein [Flavobacteriaceae bacterium F08102]
MNLTKIKLLFHTVKYLRWEQVYYRMYYGVRNRFFAKNYTKKLKKRDTNLRWESPIHYKTSYRNHHTFSFLNIEHTFENDIDWNYANYGKLWTYNLNYFDFLHQKELNVIDGISLIYNFINAYDISKDGREPYPTSLRGINWIKFLSYHKVKDEKIDQHLYNQYQLLIHNLEYHLLANHLLENAFSLFFAAYYFEDAHFFKKAKTLLNRELKEQIHRDGGHFELSPMYHQILLHRLLDCIQLSELNPTRFDTSSIELKAYAALMCSWLAQMTFNNGEIPLFNDSAKGIAVSSNDLFRYAKQLGIKSFLKPLSDSGYRVFEHDDLELCVDVGQVGPSYQPGHAHADTLSFVLYIANKPFLIDPGISTYEIGEQRSLERATKFHNTVTPIDETNSSQVWAGFRVAKRAKIHMMFDEEKYLMAEHNGFSNVYQRSFSCRNNNLVITDYLAKSKAKAHFYLAPGIEPMVIVNKGEVRCDAVTIRFSDNEGIEVVPYTCPNGYNQYQTANKIVVLFNENLITTFEVNL